MPFPKPMYLMKDRDVIRYFVELVDGFEGEIPGASKIADAIRAHEPRIHGGVKVALYKTHVEHPEWTARQLADHVGCDINYVHTCALRGGWSPNKQIQTKNKNPGL